MNHTFHLSIFRPGGPVQTLLDYGATEQEVAARYTQQGFTVISCVKDAPCINWNATTFNREEAAAFLHIKSTKLNELINDGALPRRKVYTRAELEEAIENDFQAKRSYA